MQGSLRTHATLGSTLLVAFALSLSAHAADGVVEINQAKALAGGVTSGDSGGFPVTLSEPGSYKLTGDLTVTTAAQFGIVISAEDVTVDLNGFSLRGPTQCSGSGPTLSCTPTGGGIGILGSFTTAENVSILNGTVRGFGSLGISLQNPVHDHRVEGIHAIENGSTGIEAQGRLIGNVVDRNGSFGISTFSGSVVIGNRVIGNRFTGISAGSNCVVRDNVSNQNGTSGISAGGVIENNVAAGNASHGISASAGSTVVGNDSVNNQTGIACTDGCTVRGNTSSGNTLAGLSVGATTGYGDNVINGNGSTVSGAGKQIGMNLCDGSTTCP